ncbi:methyltransferase [Qaidamihabitans albus]|uniref:methyltransferase n=1 Tax=Qaidamihabitans albus TaxID=2795733 RepID=UPI0018F18DD1|nr:methyltransferase [Qaidamihabitans albus]
MTTETTSAGTTAEQNPPADVAAMNQLVRIGDYVTPIALRVVVELRVPDALAGGPRTADDLAAEVGAHGPSLYRVLRALTASGVLHEDRGHRFALTPVSDLLREAHPYSMRGMYRLSPADLHAMAELEHGVRHEESAFEHVHGMSFWEYTATHPEHHERYQHNMWSMATLEIPAVLRVYDWSATRTLVDLGGGTGQMIAGILKEHPGMRGVLLDLPDVAPHSRSLLEREGVLDRCEIVSGDFFHSVPAGGDTYLLKRVFYDFTDDECTRILRSVRSAMHPDARVLVLDGVVRSDNRHDSGKLHDLYVLAMGQGRCRSKAELSAVFAGAGLRLTRVIPTGAFPLVEGRAA